MLTQQALNIRLVSGALLFADERHSRVAPRRYTGEPYVTHLIEVATMVEEYDLGHTAIATALLHDVVEDCGVTVEELTVIFGKEVADGVSLLSDVNQVGKRALRKEQTIERLKDAPDWIQSIKCADIISNAASIIEHDKKFAPLFIKECRALLDVLTQANQELRDRAYKALGSI